MVPEEPYYAVIFTSQRSETLDGYDETDRRMAALVWEQPGFLGVESTSNERGLGITVSYWRSLGDIVRWRKHPEHAKARAKGRERWYSSYRIRVAKVERDYAFSSDPA